MITLENYVKGAWQLATRDARPLFNPATGEKIARASSTDIDIWGALEYARDVGNPVVRQLTFAKKGEVLKQMAGVLFGNKRDLFGLSVQNSGVTLMDAGIDLFGAGMVLGDYAALGKELGDTRILTDKMLVELKGMKGEVANYGRQTYHPRRGVAVQINASNFPLWGAMEKFAQSFLAGMPSVISPATSTALVLEQYIRKVTEANILPDGALSFVVGGGSRLVEALNDFDSFAFTGSASTARTIEYELAHNELSPKDNYEKDSINSAFIGPDVEEGSLTWKIAVSQVVTEMTQKSGQKCTATRIVYVPEDKRELFYEAVQNRLSRVVVGNPTDERVAMGPVVSVDEAKSIQRKLHLIESELGVAAPFSGTVNEGLSNGYFLTPAVFTTSEKDVETVYENEIFGPVLTILPYSGKPSEVETFLRRTEGSLVTSAYSNNRDWLEEVAFAAGGHTGRLYIANDASQKSAFGPGIVDSQLTHGGPGRAGNGRELGKLLGMGLYLDDLGIQGPKEMVTHLAPLTPSK